MIDYYIVINPEGASLWQRRKNFLRSRSSINLLDRYIGNEKGQIALIQRIRSLGCARYFLLTNQLDENCRNEEIPVLNKKDRYVLVERLLDKYAGETLFRCCVYPKMHRSIEKDKFLKHRVLLYSHASTAFINNILEAIDSIKSVVGGIYALPCLSPQLALNIGCINGVILTVHGDFLRQSVIKNNSLILSRLSRLPNKKNGPEEYRNSWKAEVQRLHVYLNGNSSKDKNTLSFFVLGKNHDLLQKNCFDNSPTRDNQFDANIIQIPEYFSYEGDEIFLTLLLKNGNYPVLGGWNFILNDLAERWKLRLKWATAFIIALGIGLIWYKYNEVQDLRYKISFESKKNTYEFNLDVDNSEFDLQKNISSSALQELEKIESLILAKQVSLQDSLLLLSHVLERNPKVEIRQIEWKNVDRIVMRVDGRVNEDSTLVERFSTRKNLENFRIDLVKTFEDQAQIEFQKKISSEVKLSSNTGHANFNFYISYYEK